jgi:uncharacterized protein (DUF1330 family)
MSCYFIARIKIKDKTSYEAYRKKAGDMVRKHKGTYLAVDDAPKILEGKEGSSRLVLIRFDHEKDFQAWYESPEYQEILKIRLSAADCNAVLLHGEG